MFSIPSNKPLDLDWLKSVPRSLERQVADMPWGPGHQRAGAGLIERPLVFLPLICLCAGLCGGASYLFSKLGALHGDIGHFKHDSQLHTPMALGLNVILALPVTLFLALCGYALLHDARGQNLYLGAALYRDGRGLAGVLHPHRILSRMAWPSCTSTGRRPTSPSSVSTCVAWAWW